MIRKNNKNLSFINQIDRKQECSQYKSKLNNRNDYKNENK